MKDILLKTFSESCFDILEEYKNELLQNDKNHISNLNFEIPYDYLLDININNYFSDSWSPDNISFEQRFKKNKNELINEINQQSLYALIREDNFNNFSRIISAILKDYKIHFKAFFITESTYFTNIEKFLSYKALGIYKYKIKITEDEKTSDTCKKFKETIYNIKDYEPGKTAPPFHVNAEV